MPSRFSLSSLAPLALACIAACTAGGDVVPDDATGGTGSASGGTGTSTSGGTGVIPSTGGSTPTAAGTSPLTGGTGSMAAGASAGGTGGTGVVTTGGSGGSSGTGVVMADPYEAVKVFDNWRVDMECSSDPGKNFLSPNCQQGGDICWMKDDASGRTTFTLTKKVGGDANKLYKFKVRIRGVLEPKAFDPGNCPALFMGDNVPMRTCKCTDAAAACIPLESGFNWMRLSISAPKQRYWMNNAKDSVSHRVEVIDGQFDMEARGQADVEYFFDNLNTGEIRNCQNKLAPDLPFVDGNFFVLTIIPGSVTAVDAPI
jgi:hypothetical protein